MPARGNGNARLRAAVGHLQPIDIITYYNVDYVQQEGAERVSKPLRAAAPLRGRAGAGVDAVAGGGARRGVRRRAGRGGTRGSESREKGEYIYTYYRYIIYIYISYI